MKDDIMFIVTSLLSIVLLTFHLAEDVVLRFEQGGLSTLISVPIFIIWLYGTLVLAGRRSGYLIVLIASLLGSVAPVIHMTGKGLGAGRSTGAYFFVWTLIALSVTCVFSVILSVRGLWSLRARRTA